MDITMHQTFLSHDVSEATLAFYRDAPGFQARNDGAYGGAQLITVVPADQPGTPEEVK